MSNDVSQNPLVIDTGGASDILSASQRADVVGFWWDNGAAVTADTCVVTDTAGKFIWSQTITTSLATGPGGLSLPRPLKVKGIKVTTLSRGKLYIYLAGE
jgi:hypothetical protein